MDKYEIWLLNNRLNNKVIGSKEKTGHYYVSDAIRDYEQEQVGNVAQPDACAQLCEGWRDASKELPPEKETENIWEKGMSDNVLILLGGCYHIACYHHRAEKWMIPGFCGEWKPEAWKKIVPPAFV